MINKQEILHNAIARIKRGIEMAAKVNDEKAVEELKVTLKALEKQMSKEPILESDGYADGCLIYDTWYCPECDTEFDIDEKYKCCPNCGQRIEEL